MTEKDLDEFEKEFGFKLLPTGFKKPLSEITKEEYRERIEFLWNAIINDDSNDEDLMIYEKEIKVLEKALDKACNIHITMDSMVARQILILEQLIKRRKKNVFYVNFIVNLRNIFLIKNMKRSPKNVGKNIF